MHPLEYRYMKSLMDDHIQTQREIRERSSALLDGNLTIDEAITQRTIIEHDEEYLDKLTQELNTLAEGGFEGHNHPGALTQLFYGYTAPTPSPNAPGYYPRPSRQSPD
jgi:hypothetical protein